MKTITLFIATLLSISSLFGQIDFSEANRTTHTLLPEMDKKITNGNYERITSVLISKNGKLIYEKYYNGAALDSKHNVRSGTKTIATFLTIMAIDKGFIGSEKAKFTSIYSIKCQLRIRIRVRKTLLLKIY